MIGVEISPLEILLSKAARRLAWMAQALSLARTPALANEIVVCKYNLRLPEFYEYDTPNHKLHTCLPYYDCTYHIESYL